MEIQTRSAKTIGGYIALELPKGAAYHHDLVALNTGRNAFEYILRVRKYTLVYLPYYTCEVLLEPLHKLDIAYRFYRIDENLDPILDFELSDNSALLYTNYYGLKTATVKRLTREVKNLIVDNAQAFFCKPIGAADTFYSCRKFFGVPDGAYLHITQPIDTELKQDQSVGRFSHLIKSIDIDIEEGYHDYIENNKMLCYNDIKQMSVLTETILAGIDYAACAAIRRRNFAFLAEHLDDKNLLSLNLAEDDVPMVYPFLTDDATIKQKLIQQKIFVATYWPNVYEWASAGSYEYFLAQTLVALPIDHRYDLDDMLLLVNALKLLV